MSVITLMASTEFLIYLTGSYVCKGVNELT